MFVFYFHEEWRSMASFNATRCHQSPYSCNGLQCIHLFSRLIIINGISPQPLVRSAYGVFSITLDTEDGATIGSQLLRYFHESQSRELWMTIVHLPRFRTCDTCHEKTVLKVFVLVIHAKRRKGAAWPCPSFFWYHNDKGLEVCFLVTCVMYNSHPYCTVLEGFA